jgi:hypothetical protein
VLDEAKRERLRAIVYESPRSFGKPTSLGTLRLLAEVCFEQGVTSRALSVESRRRAFKRMGVAWKRAKHWITSPDPRYALKKQRDRLIRLAAAHSEWVLGFADEVGWSRLAQPDRHAWADRTPVRLREMTLPKEDADPKAVACYGILRADTQEVLVRFVDGRPVSHATTAFLTWVGALLKADAKKALLLVWDNASWHVSKEVRSWVRAHNRRNPDLPVAGQEPVAESNRAKVGPCQAGSRRTGSAPEQSRTHRAYLLLFHVQVC